MQEPKWSAFNLIAQILVMVTNVTPKEIMLGRVLLEEEGLDISLIFVNCPCQLPTIYACQLPFVNCQLLHSFA